MPESLPLAYVASAEPPTRYTPGRLRLRLPEKRYDADFLSRLVEEASGVEGVLEASMRECTGSLLVLHSGTNDEILNRLSSLKIFRLSPREKVSPRGAWPVLSNEERAILEGGVYLALSFVQVYRGKALGAGTSLLSQAMESVRQIALREEACPPGTEARPSILGTLANLK